MNVLLWVCQILLAVTFLYSGCCKLLLDQQTLIAKGQTGVAGLHTGVLRFIGIAEILGAAGLVFPWWMGIAPFLTPLAAGCFALVMVLAAITHIRLLVTTGNKRERQNIMVNIVFLGLSLSVAWGR